MFSKSVVFLGKPDKIKKIIEDELINMYMKHKIEKPKLHKALSRLYPK